MATATLTETMTFGDVLEAIDRLTMDDQEEIAKIIKSRLASRRREQLVEDVLEAEREYAEGRCKVATADEIMLEILS
jgi:hypothetical protein